MMSRSPARPIATAFTSPRGRPAFGALAVHAAQRIGHSPPASRMPLRARACTRALAPGGPGGRGVAASQSCRLRSKAASARLPSGVRSFARWPARHLDRQPGGNPGRWPGVQFATGGGMRGQVPACIRPSRRPSHALRLARRDQRTGDLPVSCLGPGRRACAPCFPGPGARDVAGEQVAQALMAQRIARRPGESSSRQLRNARAVSSMNTRPPPATAPRRTRRARHGQRARQLLARPAAAAGPAPTGAAPSRPQLRPATAPPARRKSRPGHPAIPDTARVPGPVADLIQHVPQVDPYPGTGLRHVRAEPADIHAGVVQHRHQARISAFG